LNFGVVQAAVRHAAEASLLTETMARNARTTGDFSPGERTGQRLAVRIATPSFNGVVPKFLV
jgi:hypothetical protein